MPVHVIAPMRDEHVNVTPLIDVVMCLIIFFLLVGQMAKEEVNTSINLPPIKLGLLNPDAESNLILNVVAQCDPLNPTTKLGNLPPRIYCGHAEIPLTKLADILHLEKSRNPDLRIALRADSTINYQFIAPIIKSCASADIRHINFAAILRSTYTSIAQ